MVASRETQGEGQEHPARRDGSEPTPDCLDPIEVERFIHEGELPGDRLAHVECCPVCSRLLEEAATAAPDLREVVVGLRKRGPYVREKRPSWAVWLDRAARVGAVSLLVALVLMQGAADRREARHRAEVAGLRSRLERTKDALHRANRRLDMRGELQKARLVALRRSREALQGGLEAELGDRAPRTWSTAAIEAWMLSPRIATNEAMADLFVECRLRSIREGVPKAVIYGKMDHRDGRAHVLAARRYLASYSDEQIKDEIRRSAQVMDEEPERIERLFEQNRERIRDLSGK